LENKFADHKWTPSGRRKFFNNFIRIYQRLLVVKISLAVVLASYQNTLKKA
jgi:hypothetical protein